MKRRITFLFFFSAIVGILFTDCAGEMAAPDPENGAVLAQVRCVSCHAFTEPDLLPKVTWENYVLPRMGYMVGIYDGENPRDSLLEGGEARTIIEAANIFPKEPQISLADWEDIKAYYLENAPQSLQLPANPEIESSLAGFETRITSLKLSPPSATLVHIRDGAGGFFVGDANKQSIYLFNPDFTFDKEAKTTEGAVSLSEFSNSFVITVMGSFSPTDVPSGILMALPKERENPPQVLIQGLKRPVHTAVADFNGDQLPEFVISEFGKWTGKLSHWSMKPDRSYEMKVIKDAPGAIRSIVTDMNNDGRSDIVALFGQGTEGIYVFYGQADGSFKEETLLSFPSTYGSSYFNLQDLDADGDLDIVYTNGDNADYPPILKPYHGIHFFENDGQNNFSESFFYHLNGAYKAMPLDFDQDGDLDIAAISFFPDFQNQPEQGFVYLENQGGQEYKASTFEQVRDGRWLTMDAGDIDLDGDLDLILGSLAFEVVPPVGLLDKWVQEAIPFVILENTLR